MKKIIKEFKSLTTRELYEILKVRSAVFVVEQECVYQDMDDVDYDSLHIFYEDSGEILACLRLFWKDIDKKLVQMGRVLTTQRGKGYGMQIVLDGIAAARDMMEAEEIYIEAQCYAIGFYEKAGFFVTSEEFLEDGIPHVKMKLEL